MAKSPMKRPGKLAMPGPRASVAVDSARASIGWRIWVFFLLLAGVVLVTDHLVSLGLRKAKTNDCGIMNRVVAGRINASIIISGSSRALHHYDPAIIQSISGHSAFNLGLNASHIDVQLALLKTYLRHNQQPDVIIQNLDDFTFGVTREQDFEYAALFKPYLDEPSIYSALRSIRPDAWKQRYIPLYTYGTQDMDFSWMIGLRALLGNNLREKRLDGYLPERLSWNDDFDRFKALNPNGVEMAVEERGVALVKELIDICKRERIVLVLVYSPEYYEVGRYIKNRAVVFDKFRELAKQENVRFWDYSASPLCQDKSYFYNAMHLNQKGAEAFSKDVARHLQQEIIPELAITNQ